MNRYHFRCKWRNGDPLVICSYGINKRDAYIKILLAIKNKQFKYRKGDSFSVSYYTNEECERDLLKKGLSKNESAWLSVYGHTSWIVKDGKVIIN